MRLKLTIEAFCNNPESIVDEETLKEEFEDDWNVYFKWFIRDENIYELLEFFNIDYSKVKLEEVK